MTGCAIDNTCVSVQEYGFARDYLTQISKADVKLWMPSESTSYAMYSAVDPVIIFYCYISNHYLVAYKKNPYYSTSLMLLRQMLITALIFIDAFQIMCSLLWSLLASNLISKLYLTYICIHSTTKKEDINM